METLKTAALFKQIEDEIKEIESTELKLSRLLKILKIEYEKISPFSSINFGSKFMCDSIEPLDKDNLYYDNYTSKSCCE